MKTSTQSLGLSRTLVALAVALAFGPSHAQEAGGIARGPVNGPGYTSTAPESSISVGVVVPAPCRLVLMVRGSWRVISL